MIPNFFRYQGHIQGKYLSVGIFCLSLLWHVNLNAQTTNETMASGSYIVNMGLTPQTASNALRPYGMVYDLLKNFNVPIRWVINPTKAKDGVDFTYNNVAYRGGAFVIPAEFRTAAVNGRIAFWQGRGVVGVTTTSPVTLPVNKILLAVPKWTLDQENGDIAVKFFQNAEIPPAAYGGSSSSGWKKPGALDCCDDLFVMPHADPVWKTHGNLLTWNLTCKGGIWLGCKAGSSLESMFNPANRSQQTNFLAEKTGTATGSGPYSQNAVILADNHSDGTPPYLFNFAADPVMQFLGTTQQSHQSGAEEIYIPLSPGWRPTTKVGVYDPDHPQRASNAIQNRPALVVWGPGLGDSNRGQVMMEAGHDIAKAASPDYIAAQRAFFNFSLVSMFDKAVLPTLVGVTPTLAPGQSSSFSVTVPPPANIGSYTVTWSSSCGGSFSPTTGANVTFTAPNIIGTCTITAMIRDACGRQTFSSTAVTIRCNLTVTTAITQVCGSAPNSGAIAMTITGGTAPFNYTWTRSEGGTGSGSGTTISNLAAGTYTVTVNSANGCASTFTVTVSSSPTIVITPTVVPVSCNGQATGAINLTVSGGTPGYTYNWGGGITTQNRSGLTAGSYGVTVTDSRGCTATQSGINVTQPAVITATPTRTNVLCRGESTGAITLAVSGGTSPYSYLWNDGVTTQNRSGLAAGTYSVTVTDSRGCTATVTNQNITQPAAVLAATFTTVAPNCGVTNGSITANVTGGTAPYTYDWAGTPTGDGTATITGLGGGSYQLTVTDANGCTLVVNQVLNGTSTIILTADVTPPTCPPGSNPPLGTNGAIDLTVTGGASPYTYAWATTNGAGLIPTNQDQTNLSDGTYTVVVTDANTCTATTSVTLTAINPAPVQPTVINNN